MANKERSSIYLPVIVVHLTQGLMEATGVSVDKHVYHSLRAIENLDVEPWVLRAVYKACLNASQNWAKKVSAKNRHNSLRRHEDIMVSRRSREWARSNAEKINITAQEYLTAALFFHCFALQPVLSWDCLFGQEDLGLDNIKNKAFTWEELNNFNAQALNEIRAFYGLPEAVTREVGIAEVLAAQGDALARLYGDDPLVRVIMELKELHRKIGRQEDEIRQLRSIVAQIDDNTLKVRLEELGLITDETFRYMSRPFIEEIARQLGVENYERFRMGDLKQQITVRMTELGYKPFGGYGRYRFPAKREAEIALYRKLTESLDGSIYFNVFDPLKKRERD
ncbi:MAG: hypothetical protein UY48_C0005G0036 [Candidatus Gottesmanbacteria bacterium GW2011_GWB1_49_7]|uniref:Uncharacterized protein n=1 Tax=Candidatus Gottesmanbacteria bacterium GW2011_GWB1_49_7 TaxID=1618448 RepID=A0A0G1W3C2_9BACT|nr:MAG: hypothetical protein UY48_C0005G0036 [Candidatus Gottesmanbacteria bacterium GW2011_GWB1_49_7]